jgi:hypothetical protein
MFLSVSFGKLLVMPWIKSPFEVPIPTQKEISPTGGDGACGSITVDSASRMKLPAGWLTGPVLKAGPLAVKTRPKMENSATARSEEIIVEDGNYYLMR